MLFKKLDLLKEEEFTYFRAPFDSRRQTPKNIRKGLMIATVVQIFIMFAAYGIYNTISDDNMFYKIVLLFTELAAITLIVFSLIYSVSKVYGKRQHIQYILANLNLLSILGILSFNLVLLIFKTETDTSENTLLIIMITGLFFLLFFLLTVIVRLYRSLLKGAFRKGSDTHGYEKALEKD